MAAGSISKRSYPNGRTTWRAQLPVGRKKREKQFATKREAERWMTEQRAAVQRGEWIDPALGRRTFAAVAEEWCDAVWPDLAPRTRQAYESLLRQINMEFGQDRIAMLDAHSVQDYVNKLGETRKVATVRRYFVVLSGVMKLAVERRYIATNPCASVRLPKRQRGVKAETLFLTPDEVRSLAEAVPAHWRTSIYVAAYTGLRAGELWALRRNDVDLLHGTLRVDEALKDVAGVLEFGEPKSEASRRTFSLPQGIADLLADHLETEADAAPDALVFTSPTGEPVRHGLFYQRFYRPAVQRGHCAQPDCQAEVASGATACPECGSDSLRWVLPPAKHALRFHDLRHTAASMSLAVSPNPYAVMKRLGHEDIKTTIKTYGHLLPDADAAVAAELHALFAEANQPTKPTKVTAIRS